MVQFVKNLYEICREDTSLVGGKGANLAKLSAAGFPVPPGFCITTKAYEEFIQHAGLKEKISTVIETSDPFRLEQMQKHGAHIRQRILESKVPQEIHNALLTAYRGFPREKNQDLSVAVRSSATTEDLSSHSSAGQHDTYLNISRQSEFLQCVKKCWASLWTNRAIAYRTRNAIDQTTASMAVIVQQMIPSDVSGITFTVDPVTRNRNELIINASWGLGKSVVSGRVSPDEYTVRKDTLAVTEKKISNKIVMSVPGKGRTQETPVPSKKRRKPCLPDKHVQRLASLGKRIEDLFHAPQDIEWGIHKDRIYILQSRTITTSIQKLESIPVVWGSQFSRKILKDRVVFWSNWNTREIFPHPLTPMAWSHFTEIICPAFFECFLGKMGTSALLPYSYIIDLVYGRMYWNMNMIYGHPFFGLLFRLFLSHLDEEAGNLFKQYRRNGELNSAKIPGKIRFFFASFLTLTRIFLGFPLFFRKDKIEKMSVRYWQEALEFENIEIEKKSVSELLNAMKEFNFHTIKQWAPLLIVSLNAFFCFGVIRFLTRKWKDLPCNKLMAGISGNKTTEGALELYKLSQVPETLKQIFLTHEKEEVIPILKKNEEGKLFLQRMNRFLELFGHRGVKEFDMGHPRWKDDPSFLIQMIQNYLQLDGDDPTPLEHFQQMAQERERLTKLISHRLSQNFFSRIFPIKKFLFKKMLHIAQTTMPLRENPKYYALKCFSGSRRIFLEIGRRLHQQGYIESVEDVFFLTLSQLETLSGQEISDKRAIKNLVRRQKDEWNANSKMDPPFVVRSDGKTVSMAEQEIKTGKMLKGIPVSSGKVRGVARVILDPSENCSFNKGEILVAPHTDPGWTPLFLTAKALVMEVGGTACHGAIVAREYGIPAVVGVKGAIRAIRNGDEIMVDGDEGKVFLR